jgi:hypothetical protein
MTTRNIIHPFFCPITTAIMVDPVFCADGVTYERAAIELWLQSQNVSPVSGQVLFHKNLSPNDRLRAEIEAFQQQQQQQQQQQRRQHSPPPLDGQLPSGWQSYPNAGSTVYVNCGSGEISHERPSGVAETQPSAPVFLSRDKNAVFKQRNPVHYNPVWEWEDDHGIRYESFDPALVEVLEPRFRHHMREHSEASANFTYEKPGGGTWVFNFDFMMQTNPGTGSMRAIRRK